MGATDRYLRVFAWVIAICVVAVVCSALARAVGADDAWAKEHSSYWAGFGIGITIARYAIWHERFAKGA